MRYIALVIALMLGGVAQLSAQTMKNTTGKFYRHDSRIARDHNVCKKLRGDVLIYALFCDTESGLSWTQYDVETTLDSIKVVKNWLEAKAKEAGVKLRVKIDHAAAKQTSVAGRSTPRYATQKNGGGSRGFEFDDALAEVLEEKKGVEGIVNWGDQVVRQLTGLANKERLISKLRNEHYVESVAFLYMMNNYFKDDVLVAFNTMSNEEIEFAVCSYKYPAYMTNIILHLFGACSLYNHPYMSTPKNKRFLSTKFKRDVMAHPESPLGELEIGKLTAYMIGWDNSYVRPGKKLKEEQQKAFNEGPIPAKNRGDYRKSRR